jgi:hypothetical protein
MAVRSLDTNQRLARIPFHPDVRGVCFVDGVSREEYEGRPVQPLPSILRVPRIPPRAAHFDAMATSREFGQARRDFATRLLARGAMRQFQRYPAHAQIAIPCFQHLARAAYHSAGTAVGLSCPGSVGHLSDDGFMCTSDSADVRVSQPAAMNFTGSGASAGLFATSRSRKHPIR